MARPSYTRAGEKLVACRVVEKTPHLPQRDQRRQRVQLNGPAPLSAVEGLSTSKVGKFSTPSLETAEVNSRVHSTCERVGEGRRKEHGVPVALHLVGERQHVRAFAVCAVRGYRIVADGITAVRCTCSSLPTC